MNITKYSEVKTTGLKKKQQFLFYYRSSILYTNI